MVMSRLPRVSQVLPPIATPPPLLCAFKNSFMEVGDYAFLTISFVESLAYKTIHGPQDTNVTSIRFSSAAVMRGVFPVFGCNSNMVTNEFHITS